MLASTLQASCVLPPRISAGVGMELLQECVFACFLGKEPNLLSKA